MKKGWICKGSFKGEEGFLKAIYKGFLKGIYNGV